jgi:negative regulator of sigma E activity
LDGAYDLQPQQDQLLLLESASALMDNQAEPLEVRRILREFSGNAQLASKWRRYHLISAGIHHDLHLNPAVDLLTGIHARLAAEALPILPAVAKSGRFLVRFVGQGVIAASFALVALMAVSVFNQSGQNMQPAGVVAAVDTTAAVETKTAAADLNSAMPVVGGEYNPSELSRTASLDSSLDAAALARLQNAVNQEFLDAPVALEIPVNYSPKLLIDQD